MLKSKIKICALSFVILTSGCAGAKEALRVLSESQLRFYNKDG